MTVKDILENLDLKTVNLSDPDRVITGGYVGDLLSWVMGRANSGDAWVTIMTNVNVLAVASLADTACVIIAEGSDYSEEFANIAKEKEINVFQSSLSSFEICSRLTALLKQ